MLFTEGIDSVDAFVIRTEETKHIFQLYEVFSLGLLPCELILIPFPFGAVVAGFQYVPLKFRQVFRGLYALEPVIFNSKKLLFRLNYNRRSFFSSLVNCVFSLPKTQGIVDRGGSSPDGACKKRFLYSC